MDEERAVPSGKAKADVASAANTDADDMDVPATAYVICENRVRHVLRSHIAGTHELNSVTSAIMTHAQEYALELARLYQRKGGKTGRGAVK